MRYIVMNRTDGILADPRDFNLLDAQRFVKEFPTRYEAQGYYRNNRGEKVDPKDVELEIVEFEGICPECKSEMFGVEDIGNLDLNVTNGFMWVCSNPECRKYVQHTEGILDKDEYENLRENNG